MLQLDAFTDIVAFFAVIFFIAAGTWNVFTSRTVMGHQYDRRVSRYSLIVLVAKRNRLNKRAKFSVGQSFDSFANSIARSNYEGYSPLPSVPNILIAANKLMPNNAMWMSEAYTSGDLSRFDVVNKPLKGVYVRGYAHA